MLSQLTRCAKNLVARHSSAAHHLFRRLTEPARPNLVTGTSAALPRTRVELPAENALLRQQLVVLRRHRKTPRLTGPEPLSLLFLARWVPSWEASPADCQAGHAAALAPSGFSAVPGVEVARAGADAVAPGT